MSLVSGRHRVYFLEPDPPRKGAITFQKVKRTVDLEATESHGYAFAPDGKTFRTIAFERNAAGEVTKLEVLEVDATTGKTLKSLLKVDYGDYVLSTDGKRLATIDKNGKVTVYDVDRGARTIDRQAPGTSANLLR